MGIRVGIGGWNYAPWRGTFYPPGLLQRRELEYASGQLSSIEINGTFYAAQKPEVYERWRAETPAEFVFSLKAPRYATHRRKLSSAGQTVERFLTGGVLELKEKLGPINWQLAPEMVFDPGDFEEFLKLLPPRVQSQPLRHAVEVRHASFRCAGCVEMARRYGVALVIAGDSDYPQLSDITAPFVYVRMQGTLVGEARGYPSDQLDRWAERLQRWSQGHEVDDMGPLLSPPLPAQRRDVFAYVISGHKVSNPAAALALIERLR